MIVLGIAQVQYIEDNVLNFHPLFFVLFAAAIVSELLFVGPLLKRGFRISIYLFLLSWAVVYALVWVQYWRLDTGTSFQELLLQFILVELAAGLAYDAGRRIGQIDKVLEDLSSSAYPNRTRDIHAAQELINDELTRCRRYHHPLSLLVVKLERIKENNPAKQYEPLERDMLERFANAKIGQILNELLRSTDIILQDHDGHFVLLCPETEYQHMLVLAERLSTAVMSDLNSKISWGFALFPDEALNFKDLLQVAKQRIAPAEIAGTYKEVAQLTTVK
jgi:GGDEF domain-containing protein